MSTIETPMPAERRVLCVDDEPSILRLCGSLLASEFEVATAGDGVEALDVLARSRPFGVVVSDLHMPRMKGPDLLREVHRRWPCSARLLLTGEGDVGVAATAINAGHVFQFLTKPVDPATLLRSVRDASREACRLQAERDLLAGTLQGSVRVLTQILSLVNPMAFGRSARMAQITRHLAEAAGFADGWQYETAALLSQIGWIAIPPDTLQKAHAQLELSEREEELLRSEFQIAHDLLVDVPRLQPVARMIRAQADGPAAVPAASAPLTDVERFGSQMLSIASLIAREEQEGSSRAAVLAAVRRQAARFDARLLAGLDTIPPPSAGASRAVTADRLTPNMVVEEDVRTRTGTLMVARGQHLTPAAIRLLWNAHQAGTLREPFRVTGG